MSDEERSPPPAKRRLPGAVIALGMTSFFTDLGSDMIFPLLPVLLMQLHASATFLGLIEGLADAVASAFKLVSGELADRASKRKPIVLAGYSIAAIVRPLMAFATAPWHVLVIRVSDRVGKGIRSAPRDVIIATAALPGQEGRAFGFHRAMDHAGAVVGPIVATALLAAGVELRTVFLVAIVPGVLSVLCVLAVREPPAPLPSEGAPRARSTRRMPTSLRTYLLVLAVFALGNSSDAFLLLRARDLGVPVALIPMLWMVLHVSKLVSSYIGGGWADRVPRRRLVVIGWAVYALTYLALGLATEAWHAWALFVVYGAYYGLTEPAEKALVKELAPDELRGRAYGFYNFIGGAMAVPAGLLTGWVWDAVSPLAALSIGAALAALAAVLLIALRPSEVSAS
ncbi:MAG: MFS transporter [Myxococcota bacterium]|nr:MFS transporter [Myxococcota bacterium]